jgi:hypothetical protein
MFISIHRSPEGAESAGTATVDTGSQAPDTSVSEGSPAESTTQTQAPEGKVSKGRQLAELLKKKPGYQATDAELDLIDAMGRGELKPEGDEEPAEAPEEPVKEAPKPKPAEASSLMKELNAKTEAEALENLKKLKAFTGSRDAQAYKALETEHQALKRDAQAEMALWRDLKAGAPKAIQYLESQLAAAKAKAGIPQAKDEGKKPFIDPSRFTVPEEAEALNSALGAKFGEYESTIQELKGIIHELKEKDTKRDQEHQLSQAQAAQLDEMLDVAGQIPEMKDITGLRDKFSEWIKGKDIPELQVYEDLFKLANQEKVSLRVAWKMMKADRLESQVAGAEDRGLKKAFNHKPNQTLSDMQGRGGITYTHYTDSQLKAMATGSAPIPAEWFDKHDNLDKTKMPKRAIELLLANEEGD